MLLQRGGRSGAVVAIVATVIVAVVGAWCSKPTSGGGASWTTGGPPNPNPGISSSPSSSAAPSATASAPFLGQWHVHDGSLDITPTTATINSSPGAGPCMQNPQIACSEADTLAVDSQTGNELTLTVTAVSYKLSNGQTTSVSGNPGPSTAVGDSVQLVWQRQGLLKQTVLKGFPSWQGGNPYWCGAGISPSDQQLCGA
jgi:hypothetical protein